MHFCNVLKAQRRIICAKRFILYAFSELKAGVALSCLYVNATACLIANSSEFFKHYCVKFIVFETVCSENIWMDVEVFNRNVCECIIVTAKRRMNIIIITNCVHNLQYMR